MTLSPIEELRSQQRLNRGWIVELRWLRLVWAAGLHHQVLRLVRSRGYSIPDATSLEAQAHLFL